MEGFCALYRALDETTKTSAKIDSLQAYFASADPADAAWALYFLSGKRLQRLVKTALLRAWVAQEARLPAWLFEECYDAVGDLAETIAKLLPETHATSDRSLSDVVENTLLPMRSADDDDRRRTVCDAWRSLPVDQRFVFNKLITGAFRVGVSQRLVTRALANLGGIDAAVVAHRLMGEWHPTAAFFGQLLSDEQADADASRPYPFCLAHALEAEPESLGAVRDWLVEWKWDGIRAQAIRRNREVFLWSRGEELVTDRYPEVRDAIRELPNGTVLDGELLAWRDGSALPFAELQRRIGRKTVGKKMLAEVPVRFMTYDILESEGEDLRSVPLEQRRNTLKALFENVVPSTSLLLSPEARAEDWARFRVLRMESRERLVEGFMLKRRDSVYQVGRVRGGWWKWKVDPYTVDAVLVYAQRGHGRRASLYTDYTFAVWDGDTLVPFAKAYSGLTDAELAEVDAFVRRNTLEKFGPVRSVTPALVFELGFEGIQHSTRHKSGIAVRFPRMLRWRTDKKPEDANTLDEVRALLPRGTVR